MTGGGTFFPANCNDTYRGDSRLVAPRPLALRREGQRKDRLKGGWDSFGWRNGNHVLTLTERRPPSADIGGQIRTATATTTGRGRLSTNGEPILEGAAGEVTTQRRSLRTSRDGKTSSDSLGGVRANFAIRVRLTAAFNVIRTQNLRP